jgi:hypothetical protein
MKNVQNFRPLTNEQLREVHGGGLAYDIGRVLRFLAISAGTPMGTANALADWEINKIVNEIENG